MKTAIIGGGIGGIITALYRVQRGEEVTIYEKQSKLGGRLGFVEQSGFKVDEGPTIVLLPQMIRDILEEVGVEPDVVDMQQVDPVYPLHFKDGTSFYKYSDKKKQIDEISRLFPGEEDAFLSYMSDMKDRYEKGKAAFLDRDFVKKNAFWSRSNLKTLMKLRAYQTVKQQTKKYFKHDKLQESFALQTLYIGGSPESTPAIYSLVPFSEHEHGIWYIKGGYAKLAEVLTDILIERGVTIHCDTEVEKIYFEGDTAVSLETGNGMVLFDRFILNGDFPVAEKLVNGDTPSRQYTPSAGCVLMYFGLNEPLDVQDVHQFYMGENLDEQMKEIFDKHKLPEDPSFYVFNPSIIDDSLAPKGKSVAYVLIPVPSASYVSEDAFQSFAERMYGELEKRVDARLKEKTEWMKIRTPYDSMREGLFDGGSFGLAPTLFQSGVFRPQVQPFKYNNVYAVGASVHPGGGVPIVMQGAKVLSSYLDRQGAEDKAGHM
ncbi:phytoene desaturase family protein [Salisediminibacterium selenitireducens]|uniref:Phytoene desaturase n=1 Tax=Bacillus selenitireducens (strain ATCC 700615 / DSM 15326 / MLS10) TaxID=439292 RepID=D6XVI0_BACIE|nr:phytoene desaturase family protein [Salisediminibacterium selenitireducens]ADH99718.1 phytoene desaturase [[Bacillus] selenitireducens MLS10]